MQLYLFEGQFALSYNLFSALYIFSGSPLGHDGVFLNGKMENAPRLLSKGRPIKRVTKGLMI